MTTSRLGCRDKAVRDALGTVSGGVPLEESGSPYLVSPGRVTKGDGTPYKVFTPFYAAWRQHGWRAPARTSATSARWIDPADVGRNGRHPARRRRTRTPAGEAAALAGWRKFVESSLADYADDRNRPDHDGTSRMSAHLKFGTIHPRTMAADLGSDKGGQAYLRELAFRDFYANVVYSWPDSAWWNWNKNFDRIEVDEDQARRSGSKRGRPAGPASRSSTPACASWPRPGSCTTGCG